MRVFVVGDVGHPLSVFHGHVRDRLRDMRDSARVVSREVERAFSIAFNERVLVPEIPASGDGRRVLVDDIGGETV